MFVTSMPCRVRKDPQLAAVNGGEVGAAVGGLVAAGGSGLARRAGKLPAKEVALWRAVGFKIASRTHWRPPIEKAFKTV